MIRRLFYFSLPKLLSVKPKNRTFAKNFAQQFMELTTENGLDFAPTDNQKMIADTVRDFAEKNIRPHVMTWDESQEFPIDLFREMGKLGLMGVLVPEQYGGSGLGYFEYMSVIIEISKVCGSIGLSVAAHNSLCTGHILQFGNEEQKQQWLPKLASGEWIGAWGLTEPAPMP